MKNTSPRRRSVATFRPHLESLETRLTPTTYTVSSLADSGDGSLRAAIMSVNADTTADKIDFSVAGVIQLTSGPLPVITNSVNINGRTAPEFSDAPLVEIDNNGFAGLTFTAPSVLTSLSIVNANGAGVTLNGTNNPTDPGSGIIGNYIGLALDGSIAANTGVGLFVDHTQNVTIGGTAAVDRNIISGNGGGGILLGPAGPESSGQNAFVENNYIGTDTTGKFAEPNQGNGITLAATLGGADIGFIDPARGNIIAFNTGSGVEGPRGIQNPILSNSIFSNGAKGIDLQNGINQIDLPGPPQLNYAVESPGATTGTVQVQVGGVLNTLTGFTCTIQVFATLNGVPAGQGQIFLGSVVANADRNGFAAFTFTSDSVPAGDGTTFTATASAFNTSIFSNPIGSSTPDQTPNQNYVTIAYGFLLHRTPDPGSTYWVNQLNNGTAPAQVLLDMQGSAEYLSNQVAALYQQYLQRAPDPDGGQAWTNFLLAGGTLEQVAEGITSSQEYFALQGGTNQGFVTGLYRNVLNRSASDAESAGWVAALDAGIPRPSVSTAFLASQEYRTDLVQSDYMTFLLRPADDAGLAAWVNALNAGATDQQVLAQIFGSPEGYQLWS